MNVRRCAIAACAWLVAAGPLWAAVRGVVLDPGGQPLAGARVEWVATGETASTDAGGAFELPRATVPGKLRVAHPGFAPVTVEFAPDAPPTVQVRLEPLLVERVVVGATSPELVLPETAARASVAPGEAAAPPVTVPQLAASAPGVALNSQGGLQQTLSVRGLARQRVTTLLAGARLAGERRAGVSPSFVDPTLVGDVRVVRGPATTSFGSGALGGVLEVVPRRFDGWAAETGVQSEGGQTWVAAGWGDGPWSFGVARRRSGRTEDPEGNTINDRFEQISAVAEARLGGWTLTLLPSAARDAGKASTDYPGRVVTYPEENHLVARAATGAPGSWMFEAWAHPNDLETLTRRPDRPDARVRNSALDFGANWRRALQRDDGRLRFGIGLDYFGRRDVDAVESSSGTEQRSLDDGREDEAAAVATVGTGGERWSAEAGARWTEVRQDNAGRADVRRSGASGFGGLKWRPAAGLALTAQAGSGLRVPGLSERFYTGTTGRGAVIGNPALQAERSTAYEIGAALSRGRVRAALHAYRTRVRDLVEQIEIEPRLFTFENATAGTITGVELEFLAHPATGWSIAALADRARGRLDDDEPLADVPPARLEVTVRRETDRWTWALGSRWRAAKTDPDPDLEKPTPAAFTLDASLGRRLAYGLWLVASGSNLTDESYFLSTDAVAPLATRRSYGLALRWAAGAPS
ncbi:MAG: TonB-dependent receptor [Acidobacteria bacterium]|nr:TonB-dependent receptor [Acidobacteriota bacterium]